MLCGYSSFSAREIHITKNPYHVHRLSSFSFFCAIPFKGPYPDFQNCLVWIQALIHGVVEVKSFPPCCAHSKYSRAMCLTLSFIFCSSFQSGRSLGLHHLQSFQLRSFRISGLGSSLDIGVRRALMRRRSSPGDSKPHFAIALSILKRLGVRLSDA